MQFTQESWSSSYPDGVAPDLTAQSPTMLATWDDTLARLDADAPAIIYLGRTLTIGEIDRHSDALASGLIASGILEGDRIAVYLQNDPQWYITMLAAWKCGAIVVAVNPMLREKELSFHLQDSGARFLVCLDNLYDVVLAVMDRVPVEIVITTSPYDIVDPDNVPASLRGSIPAKQVVPNTVDWAELTARFDGAKPERPLITPDTVALLTYTSGTTGRAKGAMNTHRGLTHSSEVFAKWFSLDDQDVILGIAPLFHITGVVAGVCVAMRAGAPLVLLHRFDTALVLESIERDRATFTVAASTAFIALITHDDLLRRDVTSLKKVASGGAAVSPAIADRIRASSGWELRGVYGMTETTSPTHLVPLDRPAPVHKSSGALSVGVPVPGVELRIVDVVTGTDLPLGSEGEIVVRGPMVVPGYWDSPEESAHALRDGWLFTGDVGIVDEFGWLFVVDRKKDLINAGGYKIWPRDVEDVLYQHPAVREAAVVGVPDEYRGETVKAFISLVPGHTVTPQELITFTKERIAAYKYPRLVEILDEIPKNASGKMLRRELRETTRKAGS